MKCLFIYFAHLKFFMSFENSVYLTNTSPLSYMWQQIFSPSVWLVVFCFCVFFFWIMSCIVGVLKFDGVQFINFLMFFMPYLRTLTIPRSQRYLSTRTECSLTPEKSTQSGGNRGDWHKVRHISSSSQMHLHQRTAGSTQQTQPGTCCDALGRLVRGSCGGVLGSGSL